MGTSSRPEHSRMRTFAFVLLAVAGCHAEAEAEAKADPYFYNGVYGGIGHYGYPYSGVHYGVYGKRRPRLILTSTMVSMGELVTMVESMATPTPASTMESMASVRLRLSPRLMLRLILPSSALFLLSAPMDTLLFPLSAVWLEPLVWLEQLVWLEPLVWLAPLVLSAPMATPLSPLLSRL